MSALLKQKLLGLAGLLLSILIIIVATHGNTPEDSDISVTLFTIPASLYLIFTKKIISELED